MALKEEIAHYIYIFICCILSPVVFLILKENKICYPMTTLNFRPTESTALLILYSHVDQTTLLVLMMHLGASWQELTPLVN